MNASDRGFDRPAAIAILTVTGFITLLFLAVVWDFLVPLFLAAVFSGLSYPLYNRLLKRLRGSQNGAALATVLLLVAMVVLPVLILLNMIADQAVQLSDGLVPWVQEQLAKPDNGELSAPAWLPFSSKVDGWHPQLTEKIAELAAKAGRFLVSGVSAATMGTAGFLLNVFVMLYAMFFLFKDGPGLLEKLLVMTPIPRQAQLRLIDRGMSVTRATVKGTVVIGAVQGLLGGLAFAFAGIDGAAFWGAVMAVASFIPAVGTALVWVPAVGFLFLTGAPAAALGLAAFSAIVIGGIDNLLRPVLVGGDTQMPDVLILISTLGGLTMYGISGLIIGPVIAGLFVTVWDVYYLTFRDALDPKPVASGGVATSGDQTACGDAAQVAPPRR